MTGQFEIATEHDKGVSNKNTDSIEDRVVREQGAARHSGVLYDRLRAVMTEGKLELPLLPESAAKILAFCQNNDFDPAEMTECIRRDQSIAMHVLRYANSTMYSAGIPVVSLQQAVARLGFKKIREIVLIVSCQTSVFDVHGFENEVAQSFRTSLGTSAYSQELARLRRLNVEEAFLYGLFYDIGRPVLLQAVSDLQKNGSDSFCHSEVLQAVDELRVEVAALLIRNWGLDHVVADAVENQSLFAASENCQEAKVLRLAIDLAEATFDSSLLDEIHDHPMLGQLNIYADQLNSILDQRQKILDWIDSTK